MGEVCSKCVKQQKKYRKGEENGRHYVAQNEQIDEGGKILTNKGAEIDPRDVSEGTAPEETKAGGKKQQEEQTEPRKKGRNSEKKTKPRQHSSEESSDTSASSSDSDQAQSKRTRKEYTNSRGGTTIVTKTFNNYGGNITNIKNVDNLVLNIGSSRPRSQAKKAEKKTADPKPANTTNPEPCREFFSSYHTQDTIKEMSKPIQTSPFSNPVGFSSPVLNNFDDVDVVRNVLRMAGSVCKLIFPGGCGTGIRVGWNKAMITCHSLFGMLGISYTDFVSEGDSHERLTRLNVYALFNYDNRHGDPVKFYFDGDIQFKDNEETDIAVLSLRPNSDGVPFPEPFKYFSIPNSDFIFIGHPQGETKKMESVKRLVHLNDRTRMEILELRQWSLDAFNLPYDEPQMVDSVHRLLFHSNMINGASGSPGLVLVDGENVAVVTIFIHKYPDWLYDPDVAQADKDKVPEAYRISQGVNMLSVFDKMRREKPELCEEIFHSWDGP